MLRNTGSRWLGISFVVVLSACGSEGGSDDESDEQTSGVGADDDNDEETKDAGKKDAGKKDAGKTGAGKTDAGAAPTSMKDAGAKGPGGGTSGTSGNIPCNVAALVTTYCGTCHGAEPQFGAPIPLATLADFQAQEDGKAVYEAAHARVTATDKTKMPPASGKQPTTAELKTLSDWLKGGAKAGTGSCDAGAATAAKPDAGKPVATGTAGSGGAHAEPIEYNDPSLKCYNLTGFASPLDKTQPYMVPTTPDLYVAFTMNAPWEGTQYIRSFRAVIDNSQVLHHWLLFQQPLGGIEGITENAVGAHPDGIMVNGWAPGGDDTYFDPDVGMEGGGVFQLETHYNNKTGRPQPDASGVELCVSPNKPAHVAGLSWVGTDAIAGTEATGLCLPDSGEEIHLISAQPHMHLKGKHMKVVLGHASGQDEVIHDEAFDFQYQHSYVMDVLIEPGDSLTTTCTYSEFATFGKGTNDEMCYFFSIYWPAGALSSIGLGTAIHGANSCIAL